MVGGAQGLAMSDMDAIVGQIPLDPFITLGLITFGCGGVGWLLGPIVGTGIFNTMNRKYVGQMAMVSVLIPLLSFRQLESEKERENNRCPIQLLTFYAP
jgi:hypothetical protein